MSLLEKDGSWSSAGGVMPRSLSACSERLPLADLGYTDSRDGGALLGAAPLGG